MHPAWATTLLPTQSCGIHSMPRRLGAGSDRGGNDVIDGDYYADDDDDDGSDDVSDDGEDMNRNDECDGYSSDGESND